MELSNKGDLFMTEHSIGKAISELRKAKGWTQVELAERLNVSDKTISKWESEAGYPEFSMLPQIAVIFDVSLDYLIMGKISEPQIITMSKAEFCAKTDDVSLLKEIDYNQKDEHNKSLIDYIKQYESMNVFVALCTTNHRAISSFDIVTALKLCILSNHCDLLSNAYFTLRPTSCTFKNPNEIKSLLPSAALEHFEKCSGYDKFFCILPDEFFKMIVTDKRISEDTLNFLLGKQNDRQCIWYHAFPYMIDACYDAENTELLERLLTISEENNLYAYENLNNKSNYNYNYFYIGIYGNNGHGLVRILDKTLKSALQKNDFILIERMNTINRNVMNYYSNFKCGLVSDDEIRIAKLKLDKSVSKQEILVQSSIHNGILVIDELLAVNDVNLIEQALTRYPVSKFEPIAAAMHKIKLAIESEDWRYIFEYAVDNNVSVLAKHIMNGACDKIKSWLSNEEKLPTMTWGRSSYDFLATNEKENANLKYFKLRNPERFSDKASAPSSTPRQPERRKIYDIYDLAEYIEFCKKQIIDDFRETHQADKIIEELNEEFFRKELAKGNEELVAIKLCVRLEAVLKSKYHYEGDFSEMLEKYCSQYGIHTEDDGWGFLQRRTDEFVSYLQKLRKFRNSIVHSEKTVDAMTEKELSFCIEYICGLK